ncbi:RNA polymerase sigma factor [Paucihalobacter ruber]|uniref:RNA polymerase sigma factor n=1 Tax=Paucihalobacter ruber TaxID=2567861 RepID=A0A506PF65_9FLAO|nr:RNA polymerase sigma factor [Paucihalobacter ruber]TPV32513.1 RNA polymerase sigma factor [Paucihalobacter ruber]
MTTNQSNINQLITACKRGERTAQIKVYESYSKAMYNTSLRIVKNTFDAEDIMQESFITAFSKLNDLKDNQTFGAWLKRIVINNSLTFLRQQQIEVELEQVLYKIEDESSVENLEDYSEVKFQQLSQAMDTLKDNYQLALNLHYIEGYNYDEMCDILNISYANCRTLVSRAKSSLKKKLAVHI